MGIIFDEKNKIFHLTNGSISYVLQISKDGYINHLYFGKAVRSYKGSNSLINYDRGFSPNPENHALNRVFSLDTQPMEYPSYGLGDFRNPAYVVQLEDGSTISDIRYVSHNIFEGKKKLEGLPATWTNEPSDATSLEIITMDTVTNLQVVLSYTIFNDYDAVCRSAKYKNCGKNNIKILNASSMCLDFRESNFECISLYGAHINERNVQRFKLNHGCQSIESKRGMSSHQYSPFTALVRKDTNEDFGEAYGISLVYSGNFAIKVEVDQFDRTRVTAGINDFDFTWLLEENEEFQTPECVMVYSDKGLGNMSKTFYGLYQDHLSRSIHTKKERPILINNWEATYFDFTEEKILQIAEKGKELGMELFVLDDGWFGKRNNDDCSLGDWFVNKDKIPSGIDGLAKKIKSMGIDFGIWIEPEMVNEDSELYRKHPDWCIHVKNRPHTYGREQLVLDLSRKEVRDYVVEVITDVIKDENISYVKWDANRHLTNIGSFTLPADRQRETVHRYVLGLYDIMDRITSARPDILFEGCSGGGGRFDAGIYYYMPQTWTSDNTDAICRLKIQHGTSLVFPPVSMASHVSVVPNHQVGRITPMSTRGNCAMSGNLGYELDITKLDEKDQEEVKKQVAFYKEIRNTIQFGDFYRILSPFEGNETAWNFVSKDKDEAILMYFKVLSEPNCNVTTVKMKGLNPDFIYENEELGKFYGDELMYSGIAVPIQKEDFASKMWVFKKVAE